jgi:SAM-dependent methyltransferase
MNWEETIKYIRTRPEFNELVEKAYFHEDLKANVERFKSSEEFTATIAMLKQYRPGATSILDIGSGNGISAISFALSGYKVCVSEPDPSDTVGAGAILKLKEVYHLPDIEVYKEYAENIEFPNNELFDVVYVRQAMHHAYDLQQFVKNLAGLLKVGGLLLTIRDHVIFDGQDKEWFLEAHPLHKFYGGENAFTVQEYENAIKSAGLRIMEKLKHFDSVINYFPLSSEEFVNLPLAREKEIEKNLVAKIGPLGKLGFLKKLYKKRVGFDRHTFFDERSIPGRMYSFIAEKI